MAASVFVAKEEEDPVRNSKDAFRSNRVRRKDSGEIPNLFLISSFELAAYVWSYQAELDDPGAFRVSGLTVRAPLGS